MSIFWETVKVVGSATILFWFGRMIKKHGLCGALERMRRTIFED